MHVRDDFAPIPASSALATSSIVASAARDHRARVGVTILGKVSEGRVKGVACLWIGVSKAGHELLAEVIIML